MAESVVEVQNLRKEFDGTVAVADVSYRGEIVGGRQVRARPQRSKSYSD